MNYFPPSMTTMNFYDESRDHSLAPDARRLAMFRRMKRDEMSMIIREAQPALVQNRRVQRPSAASRGLSSVRETVGSALQSLGTLVRPSQIG